MWAHLLGWQVASVVVGGLVTATLSVLSLSPPAYGLAKTFFSLAVAVTLFVVGIWIHNQSEPTTEKIWASILALTFIGIVAISAFYTIDARQDLARKKVQLANRIAEFIATGEDLKRNIENPNLSAENHEAAVQKWQGEIAKVLTDALKSARGGYYSVNLMTGTAPGPGGLPYWGPDRPHALAYNHLLIGLNGVKNILKEMQADTFEDGIELPRKQP